MNDYYYYASNAILIIAGKILPATLASKKLRINDYYASNAILIIAGKIANWHINIKLAALKGTLQNQDWFVLSLMPL